MNFPRVKFVRFNCREERQKSRKTEKQRIFFVWFFLCLSLIVCPFILIVLTEMDCNLNEKAQVLTNWKCTNLHCENIFSTSLSFCPFLHFFPLVIFILRRRFFRFMLLRSYCAFDTQRPFAEWHSALVKKFWSKNRDSKRDRESV